jgi:hypothetical protein
VALGFIASLLVFIFQASVTALVPLWAVGVFLSFTLSQTGMAHRWWKIGHLAPGEELRRSTLLSGRRLKLVEWLWRNLQRWLPYCFVASFGMGLVCGSPYSDPGGDLLRHPPPLPQPGVSLAEAGGKRARERHRVILPSAGSMSTRQHWLWILSG